MSIDLRRAIRRTKSDRIRSQIIPRPRGVKVGVADVNSPGRAALVLDTNVYIMSAAGTLPGAVQDLIERGLLFHCSVCLGEIATGIGNADPSHPAWLQSFDHYADLCDSIPPTRLLTPDASTWTEAGIVAGTLARTQGFQKHQRQECMSDALIYLTAAKAGLPVLTANCVEFDLIQQVAPQGQFIYF